MYKDIINKFEAKQQVLNSDILGYEKEAEKCEIEIKAAEDARAILQLAAKKTQQKLEDHFSDLVTKAFHAVLRNPYNFSSKFIERRNHTECDLRLERNGVYYPPKFTSGGGVIDIASLGLRLAYWKLEKSAPMLFLDEPFKALSKNLIPRISELLKLLSKEFGMQFIILTHIPELVDVADTVYEIKDGNAVLL